MRSFGSYALIATYLVVQLFGQVIHAWSGCEHAHLPGHFHSHAGAHVVAYDASGDEHAGHDHCHHHCHGEQAQEAPAPGDGWNVGHPTTLAVDGCLLCAHLALGQVASAESSVAVQPVAVDEVVVQAARLATTQWLGPNSPRAPPVA